MSEQPTPSTTQTPAVRSFKPLKPLDVALAELLATVTPCHDVEMVDLADADGRVLARDAVSALDVPGFDNSSMDGYAVCVAEAVAASERGTTRVTADTCWPFWCAFGERNGCADLHGCAHSRACRRGGYARGVRGR